MTYSYDNANRVTQTTQGSKTIGYTYNIAAGIRTITYPSGRVITEQKDLRDRLGDVSDTAGVIAQYSYDLGNRVGTRTYRNGVVAGYTYDAGNRLSALSHQLSATLIAGFTHAYDAEGNKLYEQKLHQPGNSEAYGYDNIYRLTGFAAGQLVNGQIPTPVTQTGWNLDPVGNWNTKTTDGTAETRSHSAANEITQIAVSNQLSALSYDANGNLTADATQTYVYDEGNRLVSVTSASLAVGAYSYDALGRRISKATAAGSICFFYDGARIIEEQACSGGTQATYTFGNYVDEVLTRTTSAGTLYYHQNTLWSVHALTDASGNIVERYSYDAYGLPSFFDGSFNSQPSSLVANRILFTGREYDSESGLYHYRARVYSPALGRFFQRDPLGYEDGVNLYQYVGSNPISATDPDGHQAWRQCPILQHWGQRPDGVVPDPDGCSFPSSFNWALPSGGTANNPTGRCSFTAACDNHDRCYSDCSRTKAQCDDAFRNDMVAACQTCGWMYPVNQRAGFLRRCNRWARTYAWAVRNFGEDPYRNRQEQNCGCVCNL